MRLLSEAELFLSGIVSLEAQSDDCSICKEALEGNATKVVACGHIFHQVCLFTWIGSIKYGAKTCPMCCRTWYRRDGLEEWEEPEVSEEPDAAVFMSDRDYFLMLAILACPIETVGIKPAH